MAQKRASAVKMVSVASEAVKHAGPCVQAVDGCSPSARDAI